MHARFAAAHAGLAALAAAAFTASALAVHGAQRSEDSRAFAERVVQLIAGNRYDEAWTILHPLHQRFAPRAEYVGCEMREPIPGRLESVRVLGVREEPVALGGGRFAASEAVELRIAIGDGARRAIVVDTLHAVDVGGRWRWILPAERVAQYRAGLCPDGTPARPDAVA